MRRLSDPEFRALFVANMPRLSSVAKRRLRHRPQDRKDALQAALLAAWERRAEYDPTRGSLPDWFDGILRNAAAKMQRAEARFASFDVEPAANDDSFELESEVGCLSPAEQAALAHIARGETLRSAARLAGISVEKLQAVRRGLRRVESPALLIQPTPPKPVSDRDSREAAPIDRAIAQLEGPPNGQEHADCRPCWRCRWFDGWEPANELPPETREWTETREAKHKTEREKVRIARGVRTGSLKQGDAP
ncbi:MAG: hypothetical protein IPI06_13975 [Gammaproteobacteria bacterium]|nr:hypothetical protein [Gammaproteobacteria bacterium]